MSMLTFFESTNAFRNHHVKVSPCYDVSVREKKVNNAFGCFVLLKTGI